VSTFSLPFTKFMPTRLEPPIARMPATVTAIMRYSLLLMVISAPENTRVSLEKLRGRLLRAPPASTISP